MLCLFNLPKVRKLGNLNQTKRKNDTMQTFTTTVLSHGKLITIYNGWDFCFRKGCRNEFNIHDLDGNIRFFNIQSLQSADSGIVADGFYKKQTSALARDQHPEMNKHAVLVALVVDGYIDIPETYFERRMIKSSVLRNGNLAMVVIHLDKDENMSFRVKDGNQVLRNLCLMYNHEQCSIEIYDQSQQLVVHNLSNNVKPPNFITRLWKSIKSITSTSHPRVVR